MLSSNLSIEIYVSLFGMYLTALDTWIKGFEQYVLKPEQPGQPEHPLEIQKLLTRMNRLYCKHYSDEKMTVDAPCVTSLLTREAYLKIEEPSPK